MGAGDAWPVHPAQEKNQRIERRTSSIFSILRNRIRLATSEECIVASLVVFTSDVLGSPPCAKSPRRRSAASGSSVMREVMAANTRSAPAALQESGQGPARGVPWVGEDRRMATRRERNRPARQGRPDVGGGSPTARPRRSPPQTPLVSKSSPGLLITHHSSSVQAHRVFYIST